MDAASLDLLAYLARRLRGYALCLIVAWRNDEVPPVWPVAYRAPGRMGTGGWASARRSGGPEWQGENGSASLRSHLNADASLTAHRRRHHDEAQALAQQAFDVPSQAGSLHASAQAENAMGMLARGPGDAVAACSHLEASLALVEALHDPALRAAVLNNLALAWAATGDQERALTLTKSALALVQTMGDRHREAALLNNLADLLYARGDHDAAMVHLKQAVTIFADIRTEAENMQPEIWKLTEW